MLTLFDGVQLVVFLALLTVLFKGIGEYLGIVLDPTRQTRFERFLRLRLHSPQEQTWKQYLGALLVFSVVSGLVSFFLLLFQSRLPLNPQELPDVPFALALNTAVSFLTNTDWQAYGGESTMSYFSQMVALTVQNFFSPAVGLCVAVVLCRSIVREAVETVGNFWVDLARILCYLLLPLATILCVVLMHQGTPQNFSPYIDVETFEGGVRQLLVQGPIASQEAIKVLGTNGGGFTHVSSAHPYENPTLGTNFFQAAAFFVIAFGQLYYFGKKTRCLKSVWTVYAAIILLFTAGVILCTAFEKQGTPYFAQAGVDATMGNLEGKEMRFGAFGSCLYAVATTMTSCGSVNAMFSSFTPLGGLIPLVNIQLGKMIFGGVGTGLCNIALFALLLSFFTGLLRGRTPLYLGKRIEAFEVGMAFLAFGLFYFAILSFSGAAVTTEAGKAGMSIQGAHGFSEVLYAYSSASANNGSAFASLQADTSWYNYTLASAMLLGRFGTLIPALALAGALARKKRQPTTSCGEAILIRSLYSNRAQGWSIFPVSGATLLILLISSMIVVGLVVFLPALILGPILEEIQMLLGLSG